jgi:large subunit ribosomal protein L32
MEVKSFGKCPNCEDAVLPHQACKNCGHYKGAKVIETKLERVVKRAQSRQAKQAREAAGAKSEASGSASE